MPFVLIVTAFIPLSNMKDQCPTALINDGMCVIQSDVGKYATTKDCIHARDNWRTGLANHLNNGSVECIDREGNIINE